MNIRTYKERDRKDIIELWKACKLTRSWNDPNKDIDRKINYQPELFFVGEVESRVISTAMAGYDGHRGSVFYLAVHPNFQSLGYGNLLMNHIEKELTKIGCPKLNILVRSSNEGVLSFYNKLSYSVDDVISTGKRLIPDG